MTLAFDASALQQAIDRALHEANVPPGHSNAFALIATSDGRVKAVFSTKIGNVWTVDSVVSAARGAGLEAGVTVKATW